MKVISFEGLDGVGKSTQIQLLAESYKLHGRDVQIVRDRPIRDGDSRELDGFRKFGIYPENGDVLMLLYMAQTISKDPIYQVAKKTGIDVIVDRGLDTCIAYSNLIISDKESGWRGMLNGTLWSYAEKPDITFLLRLPARERLQRLAIKGEEPPDEAEFLMQHKELEKAFVSLALRDPGRFRVIECGTRDANEIHAEILRLLNWDKSI